MFIFIIILFSTTIAWPVDYDLITLYEVHDDLGAYNHWPLQRITYDNNSRVYVTYFRKTSPEEIEIRYADDPNTWTEEDPNITPGLRNPSIYANSARSKISISASRSSYNDSPKYNVRNSSWGNLQIIDSGGAFPSNNDTPQILWDENNDAWCVYRYASGGGSFDNIEIAEGPGGVWSGSGGSQLATTHPPQTLSASIGQSVSDNTEVYAAWRELDSNTSTYYIKAAYYLDGTGWSTIRQIDSIAGGSILSTPTIRNINDVPTVIYTATGRGNNTSYYQLEYSYADTDFNFSSPELVTDSNCNTSDPIAFLNADDEVCILYATQCDPNNNSVYSLARVCLSGGSWSDPTIMTKESFNTDHTCYEKEGNILHILVDATAADKQYYCKYNMIPSRVQMIMGIL